ncbi:MAG: DEAD/DEAH box helicase [Proteobacteria bacterium]|nr:DEAD/DEAH box helicase [Pseudomonadota bacterium]
MIQIERFNQTYIKVHCGDDIARELSDYFTFEVPGARFIPSVKNKKWDGKIKLFNSGTHHIYAGLIDYVRDFAKQNNYDVELLSDFSDEDDSDVGVFINSLGLTKQPRDYQLAAFQHAITKRRSLLLSPTASGKSLIIYLICRYYNLKTLLIVPTTSLVHQMYSDFEEYGFDSKSNCHMIFSGQEKEEDKQIFISTWQSIHTLPKKWFQQFDCVIGDEAHLFKAKSLTSIMQNLSNCKYRFGFTGTLDGSQTHKLVLEGLFGTVKKVTTTSELIEQKFLSEFKIKSIVLNYDDETRQLLKKATYQDEMDFLVNHPPRNKFLCNLALSLTGNSLILYQYVDKHGKAIYDEIKSKASDRKVYFVSGEIDGQTRDDIRRAVEVETGSIIVASYGTFSTGVNITNLHNVVFASPSKSRIRNLQSIGRALRLGDRKEKACLYDVADDLQWKQRRNHTLNHFVERIKIYNEEKFEYKIYQIPLKGQK